MQTFFIFIEDTRNELIHEYNDCKEAFFRVINDLKHYDYKEGSITPIMLFDQLNRFDKSVIFWGLMNSDISKISFGNENLPTFIRKYLLERMVHFHHYGIINDFDISYKNEIKSVSE